MNSKQATYDFLNQRRLGILSTASRDGEPWGAAIYYVVDEQLNFYFMTQTGTKKYQNTKANNRAALTIADDQAQTTVQAVGTISEVPTGGEMDAVFTKLASIKTPGEKLWAPPVSKLEAGDSVVLCLKPDSLQVANFQNHHIDPANYIQHII